MGRVAGKNDGTLANNTARQDMRIGTSGSEAIPTANIAANAINGTTSNLGTAQTTVFSGWNTTTTWNISGNLTVGGALPTLRANPQSPAPTLP